MRHGKFTFVVGLLPRCFPWIWVRNVLRCIKNSRDIILFIGLNLATFSLVVVVSLELTLLSLFLGNVPLATSYQFRV